MDSLPVAGSRVHSFGREGRRFVVDGNRCSFFEFDDLAAQLVGAYQRGDLHATEERLSRSHPREDVREARRQLKELIESGLLFAPWSPRAAPQPELRKFRIESLDLWLTANCNLACTYCWNAQGSSRGLARTARMTPETASNALLLALESRTSAGPESPPQPLRIELYGGEPLLLGEGLWDILDVLRATAEREQRQVQLSMTTNATLLTVPMAERLRQLDVEVAVSLDGPKPVHDGARVYPSGRGSFAAAYQGLRYLVEAGMPGLTVRATVVPPCPELEDVVQFLVATGAPNMELGIVQSPVKPTPCAPVATPDEERDLKLRLARLFVEYGVEQGRIIDIRTANRLHDLLEARLDSLPCGAGRTNIAVLPDGQVYPCLYFAGSATLALGNLDGQIPAFPFRQTDCCHPVAMQGCDSCWARLMCSRVCPAVSLAQYGDLHYQPASACALHRADIEDCIWIVSELHRRAPEFLARLR